MRNYMVAHGVRDNAIAVSARGENNPRVPTAMGMREAQNRRVEITISGGNTPVASATPRVQTASVVPPVVRTYAVPPYGYRVVNAAPGLYPAPYVYRAY